jgi:hypothetical protein
MDERKEVLRCYGALGAGSLNMLKAIATGEAGHLDEKTRALAAYGIAMVRSDEAKSLLRHLIETADGPLRYSASEALAQIEGT